MVIAYEQVTYHSSNEDSDSYLDPRRSFLDHVSDIFVQRDRSD